MSNIFAFITGTSTGIGNSIARHLLNENSKNRVIGLGRKKTLENSNYQHLTADFSTAEGALKADLSGFKPREADTLVLINNAGVIDPIQHTGNMEESDIARHISINLTAPMILTNHFIKTFAEHQGDKLIINVSSGAASNPYDGWSCYCASKAGLEMFARVVEKEQQINKKGFKIFSISPGVIDTPMQNTIRGADKSGFSNKDKFVNLKNDNLLKDPNKIAGEFSYIIHNHDKLNDVCISF